jgi:hypothetical protein
MTVSVGAWVELSAKRHRGWPWPERSYGLQPMYGDDGWCTACCVPRHPQCGPLTMQKPGLKAMPRAWTPNWQFDVICLEASLADSLAARFRLRFRDVQWRGSPPAEARQLLVDPVGVRWFDSKQLSARLVARHGTAGAACGTCGAWRWMPLGFLAVPPLGTEVLPAVADDGFDDYDAVASPEWFGDGCTSFRQILLRRELAEIIAAAAPREFQIVEPAG